MTRNPFCPTALDEPAPSAATIQRFMPKRRRYARSMGGYQLEEEDRATARLKAEFTATRILWSPGDDDEHAWFWEAKNREGRTLAYGYMHEKDEEAVVKECGESGADVAEDAAWETR